MHPKSTAIERFLSKVQVDPDTGCHVWTAYLDRQGYGKFSANGRMVLAHRFAYEQKRGAIPSGLQIDHLCRNRSCVNPDHMEPVTPRENMARGTNQAAFMAGTGRCRLGHTTIYVDPQGFRACAVCRRANVARHAKRKRDRLNS